MLCYLSAVFTFVQATSRAVFKGLQDLLKYLLLCVEEELQKESEANIFSVFLILRLAFSIHLPPPPKQKTGGGGLSFFSSLFGSDDTQSRSKVTEKGSVEMKNVIGSGEKSVEECDGGRKSDSPQVKNKESEQENDDVEDDEVSSEEGKVPLKDESINLVDIHKHLLYQANRQSNGSNHSLEFEDPLTNMMHNIHDGSPIRTIGSPTSAFSPTNALLESSVPGTHPVAMSTATPTSTGQLLPPSQSLLSNLPNGNIPVANNRFREKSVSLSPARAAQDMAKGSPLRKGRAVSPSHLLLLELLESPRLYRPNETGRHQLADCVFLYKEVMRSLGSSKSFLLEKKFWDVLFMSTISTDRNQLGWNEKTTELYTR